jgi:predicted alpha/beta superfamily hydrolase
MTRHSERPWHAPPAAVGTILKRLQSETLADGRTLTVFLPPGYDDGADRRYPVLYLHDGQNLFDPARAFGGEPWRVDRTATQLIEAGRIAPTIIVGVDHTGTNRITDYTPTHDRKRGGGGADAHGGLLLDQVMPLVDRKYRTIPGAPTTAIGGSSLGGLVSLYLALKHPRVFGAAIVMSPSVWWDHRAILRDVRRSGTRTTTETPRPRLWVDMGTHESRGAGSARRVLDDARLLRAGLIKAGWTEGVDLHYEEIAGGTHSERAWGDRFARVLEWLYGRGKRDHQREM